MLAAAFSGTMTDVFKNAGLAEHEDAILATLRVSSAEEMVRWEMAVSISCEAPRGRVHSRVWGTYPAKWAHTWAHTWHIPPFRGTYPWQSPKRIHTRQGLGHIPCEMGTCPGHILGTYPPFRGTYPMAVPQTSTYPTGSGAHTLRNGHIPWAHTWHIPIVSCHIPYGSPPNEHMPDRVWGTYPVKWAHTLGTYLAHTTVS